MRFVFLQVVYALLAFLPLSRASAEVSPGLIFTPHSEQVGEHRASRIRSDGVDQAESVHALGDRSFDVETIVSAIGNSAAVASQLREVRDPQVKVHDISGLFGGAAAAAVDSSLTEHTKDVEELRDVIAHKPSLTRAIQNRGFSPARIVAAQVDEAGSTVIFAW